MTSDIRQHVHSLVDKANEAQLDAVLSILESDAASPYTAEDIDGFYKRAKEFEEGGSTGFSVEESHANIRERYKQHGV